MNETNPLPPEEEVREYRIYAPAPQGQASVWILSIHPHHLELSQEQGQACFQLNREDVTHLTHSIVSFAKPPKTVFRLDPEVVGVLAQWLGPAQLLNLKLRPHNNVYIIFGAIWAAPSLIQGHFFDSNFILGMILFVSGLLGRLAPNRYLLLGGVLFWGFLLLLTLNDLIHGASHWSWLFAALQFVFLVFSFKSFQLVGRAVQKTS